MSNSTNIMRFRVNRITPLGCVLLAGLLITIIEFAFGIFAEDQFLSNVYIVQLCIIFFVSYAECVKRLGWLHLFSLLHFSTFVFIVGSMFFSLFGNGMLIREVVSPAREIFTESIVQHTALIFSAYIATSNLVFFSKYDSNLEKNGIGTSDEKKEDFWKIGRILVLIGLPFSVWTNLFTYLHVNREALFLAGGRAAVGIPLWARILDTLTVVGYLMIVASKPPYKKIVKYTLLRSIPMIPLLLFGERGETLMIVLFFFWYSNRFYNKKYNFVYIAVIGLLGLLLTYFIQAYRSGITLNGNPIRLIIDFLSGNSTTVKLTSFYVEYADELPYRYPFFLDQAISGLFGLFGIGEAYTGQSLHTLEGRSALGHQLTYFINPGYYLSGASMGTAWVTECYQIGLIGVILGGAVLAMFVLFLDTKIIKSKIWSIFIYEFFSLIILSPRGSLLPSIYLLLKYGAIVLMTVGAYDAVTSRKIVLKSRSK